MPYWSLPTRPSPQLDRTSQPPYFLMPPPQSNRTPLVVMFLRYRWPNATRPRWAIYHNRRRYPQCGLGKTSRCTGNQMMCHHCLHCTYHCHRAHRKWLLKMDLHWARTCMSRGGNILNGRWMLNNCHRLVRIAICHRTVFV